MSECEHVCMCNVELHNSVRFQSFCDVDVCEPWYNVLWVDLQDKQTHECAFPGFVLPSRDKLAD